MRKRVCSSTKEVAGAMAAAAAIAAASPAAALSNPASDYCVGQGGRVEIVDTPKGQIGMCHLPDGRTIEEWAFFRAKNRPASGR